jgi:hypothetical protein
MYEPIWNANCKTCGEMILISPPLIPNEHREKACRACGSRHKYSAEDVYEPGTKLTILQP